MRCTLQTETALAQHDALAQHEEVLRGNKVATRHQSFERLSKRVLSTLMPSSSCSATRKSGNETGMIRRGDVPGTQEYFSKSVMFSWSRKKSSSRKHCPVTSPGGDLRMARMASEKIVGFRRSLLSARWDSVAADSMAYTIRLASS